ncbi:MAG: ribose 5-phosphate isomerase B, partial [Nitrospina sp.]|nr:ribose 5-phosphate isomerase B [Nitrospina sp.]
LKLDIVSFLNELGYQVKDMGPKNQKSVDYPDYGVRIAQVVTQNTGSRGILICGTGIGMSIVVNRFPGIRGTLCSDLYTAKLCREHNDSNILIMGGRIVGHGLAREIVSVWLNTPFDGGRHQKRLDKINQLDKSNKI